MDLKNNHNDSSSSTSSSVVFTCTENPVPAGLNELRQKQELIDLHVKSGKQLFPAHRLILMTSCPMLSRMLSKEWDPEKKDICELGKDVVHPDICEDLLGFLYTRKVVITMENAQLLCIAANYLEIMTLKDATDQFLCDHIQISLTSFTEWFDFAQMFQLESFSKCCTKFVSESYDFPDDKRFLELSCEFLIRFFKDLQEPVSNMVINDGMFKLLIKWVNFGPPARLNSLFKLFESIPLIELSEHFFKNIVCKEKMIIESTECSKLVNNVLNELSLDSQPTSTEKTSKQHLYCFGGYRFREGEMLGSVSHLDVSTGRWTELTPMKDLKDGFSILAIGHKVYIFGGFSRSTKKFTNRAQVFDTKRNQWTELRPMPFSRESSSAVAVGDYIYVCSYELRELHRYCVVTNEWPALEKIFAFVQYDCQLISYDDHLYATNGHGVYKLKLESNKPVTQICSSKNKNRFANRRWESVALDRVSQDTNSNFQPRPVPITVHENKFFQFYKQSLTVYDPETNTIQTLNDHTVGEYMYSISSHDKIWCMNLIGSTDVMEFREYDLANASWKMLDIKNDGRRHFKAVVINR